MKGFRLLSMLALLTAFVVGPAVADDYYVYMNRQGRARVLDYVPVTRWTRVEGPFATSEAAQQTWGIRNAIQVENPPREDPLGNGEPGR